MKAIILAAGMGARLRPLTDNMPKCLVPVHGKPLLEYALDSLDRVGIEACVIVIGFCGDQIMHVAGERHGQLKMTYVDNPIFHETNNIYSFWLAHPEMNDDILLLEGDLLFDGGLIGDLIAEPNPNVAVVDPYQDHMDGTVIMAEQGLVNSMVLKAHQGEGFDYGHALKTVNIYKFSRTMLQDHFLPGVGSFSSAGRTDQYYEAVLADLIGRRGVEMAVQIARPRKWAEVDDVDDLRLAEQIFRRSFALETALSASSRITGNSDLTKNLTANQLPMTVPSLRANGP